MILKIWIIKIIDKIMYLIKLQIWKRFLASIIVKTIIIDFYKTTHNIGLTFNLAITEFYNLFYTGILAFLFTIIYCDISKY